MPTQSSAPILASTLYRLYASSATTTTTTSVATSTVTTAEQGKTKSRVASGNEVQPPTKHNSTTGKSRWTAVPHAFAENHVRDDGYQGIEASRAAKRLRTSTATSTSLLNDSSRSMTNPEGVLGNDGDVPRLITGLAHLDDEVLDGGLSYGISISTLTTAGSGGESLLRTESDGIIGLATPANDPGCEIVSLSFIAGHLLNHSRAKVYYIDAETSVSASKLERLYSLIFERIKERRKKERERFRHGGGFVYSRDDSLFKDKEGGRMDGEEDSEVKKEADEVLERMEWMRVLDFEGLMEAVGEVSSLLRRPWSGGRKGETLSQTVDSNMGENGQGKNISHNEDAMDIVVDEQPEPTIQKREVADSEDEDEEEIIATPQLATNHEGPIEESNLENSPEKTTSDTQLPPVPAPTNDDRGPTLLITSPLPKLITPLMKRNHVSGHALLSNLLRSLRHLVQECEGILVILCNSTINHLPSSSKPRPGTYSSAVSNTSSHHHRNTVTKQHEEPSAFMNISARPALGRTFNWGLDVSLMATRFQGRMVSDTSKWGQETRDDDDESVQRNGEFEVETGGFREEEGERPVILEVLHDRVSDRMGRWGLFVPESIN